LLIFASQGQEVTEKKLIRIYGAVPTSNENMKWEDKKTAGEKYVGVISLDSSISSAKIIEAFMATFQSMQDANIMTKQMRNNNAFGAVASTMSGDMQSLNDFSEYGSADSRNQYQQKTSWTVQFIDGVKLVRFYYNVSVHSKDGRYKLTLVPSGTSGYALDHVQTTWGQMYKNGELKSRYIKYYDLMITKLELTVDQWIKSVNENIVSNVSDDW